MPPQVIKPHFPGNRQPQFLPALPQGGQRKRLHMNGQQRFGPDVPPFPLILRFPAHARTLAELKRRRAELRMPCLRFHHQKSPVFGCRGAQEG